MGEFFSIGSLLELGWLGGQGALRGDGCILSIGSLGEAGCLDADGSLRGHGRFFRCGTFRRSGFQQPPGARADGLPLQPEQARDLGPRVAGLKASAHLPIIALKRRLVLIAPVDEVF
jgi:hypothetical protein